MVVGCAPTAGADTVGSGRGAGGMRARTHSTALRSQATTPAPPRPLLSPTQFRDSHLSGFLASCQANLRLTT